MPTTTIRETQENLERQILCKSACFSADGGKRAIEEEKCPLRTEFQRDRDRIIHSESFRCLMNKTQVFLAPNDAHYRTRLTHTLEVSQIARTIANGLSLNGDLTEAVALGHDLGHTPFGHAGERMLHDIMRPNSNIIKNSPLKYAETAGGVEMSVVRFPEQTHRTIL